MSFTYDYPRPAVTVDCVVFGLQDQRLRVLLIRRARPPFEGQWALPGGFVDMQARRTACRLRRAGKGRLRIGISARVAGVNE